MVYVDELGNIAMKQRRLFWNTLPGLSNAAISVSDLDFCLIQPQVCVIDSGRPPIVTFKMVGQLALAVSYT